MPRASDSSLAGGRLAGGARQGQAAGSGEGCGGRERGLAGGAERFAAADRQGDAVADLRRLHHHAVTVIDRRLEAAFGAAAFQPGPAPAADGGVAGIGIDLDPRYQRAGEAEAAGDGVVVDLVLGLGRKGCGRVPRRARPWRASSVAAKRGALAGGRQAPSGALAGIEEHGSGRNVFSPSPSSISGSQPLPCGGTRLTKNKDGHGEETLLPPKLASPATSQHRPAWTRAPPVPAIPAELAPTAKVRLKVAANIAPTPADGPINCVPLLAGTAFRGPAASARPGYRGADRMAPPSPMSTSTTHGSPRAFDRARRWGHCAR